MTRFLLWLGIILFALPALSEEVPRMTKEELKGLLGAPDLVILDVRQPSAWQGSLWKIAGSVREDPGSLPEWISSYRPDKTYVLYCT